MISNVYVLSIGLGMQENCIAENIVEFRCLDYLEENSLANDLIMANGY